MKAPMIILLAIAFQIAGAQNPEKANSASYLKAKPTFSAAHSQGVGHMTKARLDSVRNHWYNRLGVHRATSEQQVAYSSDRLKAESTPSKSSAIITAGSVGSNATVLIPEKATTHQLPFAAVGNTLELSITNTSSLPASDVQVEAFNLPGWIKLSSGKASIDTLPPNEAKSVSFGFSIDKFAPINKEAAMSFRIKMQSGESWTKDVRIQVSAPDKYELFQNYPNPFNPVTVLSYQLPANSHVSLKVYNIVGQEVVTLVDGEREAGYHQETFDAARFASGTYIYRMTAQSLEGKQQVLQRKMILVK